MSKFIVCLGVIGCLMGQVAAAAAEGGMNGSFEDGLKGWRIKADEKTDVTLGAKEGVDGKQCLVVTTRAAETRISLISKPIVVPAPDRPTLIELSYRLTNTCSPADICLSVEFLDQAGKPMTPTGVNRDPEKEEARRATYKFPAAPFIFEESPRGDWVRRSYLVPTAITPPARMVLTVEVGGNQGRYWLDEVDVRSAPDGFEMEPDRLLWCVPYRRGVGKGPATALLQMQASKSPFLATADAYHRCLSLLGKTRERFEHLRRAAYYAGQKPDVLKSAETELAKAVEQVDACYRDYGRSFLNKKEDSLPGLNEKLGRLEGDLDRLLVKLDGLIITTGSDRAVAGQAGEPAAPDVKPVITTDGKIDRCVFSSWAKDYHIEALMPFGDLGQFLFSYEKESPQRDKARYLFQTLPFLHGTAELEDVVQPDFYKKHKKDSACLRECTTHYTNAAPRKDRVYVNFLNPEVRNEIAACAEEMARAGATNKQTMIMILSAEDRGPYASVVVDGQEISALPGYDRRSQEEFRNYLLTSYKTIEALNRELGTAFTNFDSVAVPAVDLRKIARPNPLLYVFVKWLHQRYAALRVEIYQALKKGNPKGIVMCDHSYWLRMLGFDPLSLFEGCDLLGMHHAGTGLMVQNMMASLQRYKTRTLACFEEHGHGDMQAVDEQTKLDLKLVTLGRYLNLDHKIFELGQSYSTGPHSIGYGSSYWANPTYDCSTFRYHTIGIPRGMERVRRLEKYLQGTQPVPMRIAMMVPETSFYWQQPHGPTQRDMNATFNLLYPLNYQIAFEPEKILVDGSANLDAYDILLVPRAPHFPRGLWPRLEAWVKKGGNLIAIGAPCGIFDEYGYKFSAEQSLSVKLESPGDVSDGSLNTNWDQEIAESWGNGEIRIHNVGKGRYVAVPLNMEKVRTNAELRQKFVAVLDGMEFGVCSRDSEVELSLRKHADGSLYVFAINPKPQKTIKGTIRVKGQFDSVKDVGIYPVTPVPVVKQAEAADQTVFRYTLGPGAWTLYELRMAQAKKP